MVIPKEQLTSTNFLMNYFFGIKNKGDKELLSEILKETDMEFVY